MKDRSYWLATSETFDGGSATPPAGTVDVVVVGGGLTGLSTAYHLSKAGATVAVLEAQHIGWGASGRNGGMATTGLAVSFSAAIRRFGLEQAVAMRQRYNDAIDLIEAITVDEGQPSEFRRVGLLNLAARKSHIDHYRLEAELISEHTPHQAHFIDPQSISAEIRSDAYYAGMVDPAGAAVHPGQFVKTLADGIVARGGLIFEQSKVTDLRKGSAARHRVQTDVGYIEADQVVVATGAYSRRPFGWIQRRIAPVGSFIIVTEQVGTETLAKLIPNARVCSDSKQLLNYFRPTEDGRLVFGGRARFVSTDVSTDQESGQILQREMSEIFPELRDAAIDYMWGGLVDISMDRMVHSGERKGWHYAAGYSGHGVQMATYMGKVLASNVSGDPTNPWSHLANPPIPGHLGWPWFVPVAGLYFTFLDRLSR